MHTTLARGSWSPAKIDDDDDEVFLASRWPLFCVSTLLCASLNFLLLLFVAAVVASAVYGQRPKPKGVPTANLKRNFMYIIRPET